MSKDLLREAFIARDKRFLLLDKGILQAGFQKEAKLLEIGCAGGEAAEHLLGLGYMDLTGIDIDAAIIERAQAKGMPCQFECADACALPYSDDFFDGLISEAAFALIEDKAKSAREYYRVLRPGGRLLINDFALREKGASERSAVKGIPMLMGVQTADVYKEIFKEAGLTCIYCKEMLGEFARIAVSLSKAYEVPLDRVGQFIVSSFGSKPFVKNFFSQMHMSYYQLIFEKAV